MRRFYNTTLDLHIMVLSIENSLGYTLTILRCGCSVFVMSYMDQFPKGLINLPHF